MDTTSTLSRLLSFIQHSPTSFHAVASIETALNDAGFTKLYESSAWILQPGRSYYVCRNGSSILAFRIGEQIGGHFSFNIAASHTDSPAFKLKEKPELRGSAYVRLNTEGYGGMICSTWLDRPLSIAGRVLVQQADGSIRSQLICFGRDLVLIPNIAIHMNRDINDGYAFNKQVDMLPLFSSGSSELNVKQLIGREFSIPEDSILGSDLYLYSREHPSVWGAENEFISSGRLDDLQCVFSSLQGFLQEQNDHNISVMACFDNEEVGSCTRQGASSTFLPDTLARITRALGLSEEEYLRCLASSFMLSADNAHAVHPNHPELTDKENCVYLNQGVVVKSHAGQKYTSDGLSIAVLRSLAAKAGVPLQYFSNRSDKAGGSTLGNLAMTQASIRCVDIGLPQLAMHSCYETAGVKDTQYMIDLMTEFFHSSFQDTEEGNFRIG